MHPFAVVRAAALFVMVALLVRASAAAPPPDEAAIRAWIEQLDSTDLATRRSAAEALVAAGEPALPLLEEAFARGRHKAMGQPKIVLMKLRSMREDRLWVERLAVLRDAAPTQVFLVRRNGRPDGKATVSLRATGDPTVVEIRVEREPAGRTPRETLVATVGLDRALPPSRLRIEGAPDVSDVALQRGRIAGTWRGEPVDRPIADPVAWDWALGLVASAMPFEPDATVVLTVLSSADAQASPTASLRFRGKEAVRVGRQQVEGYAFELLVDGQEPRRVAVDPSRRLLRAEIAPDTAIETLRETGAGGRSGGRDAPAPPAPGAGASREHAPSTSYHAGSGTAASSP